MTGRPGPGPESCCTATLVRLSTSCGTRVAEACRGTSFAGRGSVGRAGPIVVRCGNPAASAPPPDTATRCRTARAADHDRAAVQPPDHRSGHTVQSAVSYTHLRAHETDSYLVCRLLLEKKK